MTPEPNEVREHRPVQFFTGDQKRNNLHGVTGDFSPRIERIDQNAAVAAPVDVFQRQPHDDALVVVAAEEPNEPAQPAAPEPQAPATPAVPATPAEPVVVIESAPGVIVNPGSGPQSTPTATVKATEPGSPDKT